MTLVRIGLNEREEVVAHKYLHKGWKVLRGGAPDFLMLRVSKNEIIEVRAVEVKSPHSDLTYEQRVYRTILQQAGIEYEVEVMR